MAKAGLLWLLGILIPILLIMWAFGWLWCGTRRPMQLKLSDLEIEILRKLVTGEAVSISSQQRVRLELAGMIREGPDGIILTLTGRSLAREKPAEAAASDEALNTSARWCMLHA